MELDELTNNQPEFYPVMGPYLSRREIVGELGGPVWDDDGKRWFVAREKGAVVGFGGVTVAGDTAHISSLYTLPGQRRQGVLKAVLEAILASIRGVQRTVIIAQPEIVEFLESLGFVAGQKRGRYTKMELETND